MYKLLQGDCLELMSKIPDKSIDAIICDLPYGITKCSWDIVIPFDKLWEQYDRIIKDNGAIILFGQEPFSSFLRVSNIENYKYDIYWEKERLTNINYDGKPRTNKVKDGKLGKLTDENEKKVFEYKDTGWRYPTQVWKFQRDCLTSNLHPTQKPIALLEELIKTYTNENELVLDNCMG